MDFLTGNRETILIWLTVISFVTFAGSLFLMPWLAVRIPADYFLCRTCRDNLWADRHPIVRWTLMVLKNMLGYGLIASGILMLALPGQGVLTIVIGVFLIDFPGKYRIERWIVSRKPILHSINWLRKRARKKPLVLER